MRKDSTPGTKCTVRGQVYVQTGSFFHTKPNGWEVRVLELDTACPHCGDSFQVTASRRQIRTRQMVRRCPTCREVHFGPVPTPPKPHLPTHLAAIMARANLCGRYVPVSAVTAAATPAERKLFGGIGRRSARIRGSFARRHHETESGTISVHYRRRRPLRVKLSPAPGAAPVAATPAVPSQQVVAPTPPMGTYQAALGMLS
jgi:predicted Zn finger-like uncharacterized protein